MKIHTDIKQGSPEWHKIREGRIGGSNGRATALLNAGKGLESLAFDHVARKHFPNYVPDDFISPAMERGIELEPIARIEYEIKTGNTVQEIGYVSKGDLFGFSPDGFVGEDGLIEIKCPLEKEYLRMLIGGKIKKTYMDQMQWGMFLSGRAWCDFVVYYPERPLIVQRVNNDTLGNSAFLHGMEMYEKLIETLEAMMLIPA